MVEADAAATQKSLAALRKTQAESAASLSAAAANLQAEMEAHRETSDQLAREQDKSASLEARLAEQQALMSAAIETSVASAVGARDKEVAQAHARLQHSEEELHAVQKELRALKARHAHAEAKLGDAHAQLSVLEKNSRGEELDAVREARAETERVRAQLLQQQAATQVAIAEARDHNVEVGLLKANLQAVEVRGGRRTLVWRGTR